MTAAAEVRPRIFPSPFDERDTITCENQYGVRADRTFEDHLRDGCGRRATEVDAACLLAVGILQVRARAMMGKKPLLSRACAQELPLLERMKLRHAIDAAMRLDKKRARLWAIADKGLDAL